MPRLLNFVGKPVASPPQSPAVTQVEQGATFPTNKIPKTDRLGSLNMDNILNFNKDKRKSLIGERPPSRKGTPKPEPPKSVQLEVDVQSPPLIFHGAPEVSTGALLGGQLRIVVKDAEASIDTLSMQLVSKMHTTRPMHKDCIDCSTPHTVEIRRWDFLKGAKTLLKGEHTFPFSHLLAGELPASTATKLGGISYSLTATAHTAKGEKLSSSRPLEVKRALPEPPIPRTSQRIFPPTNLKTELEHPALIYPIGQFTCLFRMSGILYAENNARFRWRLRRLAWTLNENVRTVAPACSRHANHASTRGKSIEHADTRPVGAAELKDGWKADYSPDRASIEMEIRVAPDTARNPACDVDDHRGFVVSHTLCIEMIVAEEVAALKGGTWGATGTARVLRTQHHISMSERAGMGIAWDEEMPPMYEDVPESPPWYPQDEIAAQVAAAESSTAGALVHSSTNATMHDYVGETIPPVEDEISLRQ